MQKKDQLEVFEQSGGDGTQLLKAVVDVPGRTPKELGDLLCDATLTTKWDKV